MQKDILVTCETALSKRETGASRPCRLSGIRWHLQTKLPTFQARPVALDVLPNESKATLQTIDLGQCAPLGDALQWRASCRPKVRASGTGAETDGTQHRGNAACDRWHFSATPTALRGCPAHEAFGLFWTLRLQPCTGIRFP